jgi:hypothetical protein
MMLKISEPIWYAVPYLSSFVIVWRLLVPISFITSIIAVVILQKFNSKSLIIAVCLITIFSTILNWGNRKMIPEDPNAYTTHWSLYTEYVDPNYINQYSQIYKTKHFLIPNLVLNRSQLPIQATKGSITYKQILRTNVKHTYLIFAKTDVSLIENTFYFPGWVVRANNKIIPINYKFQNNLGVITFDLPKGVYKVDVTFEDSPLRSFAKKTSTFSFMIFLIILSFVIWSKSSIKNKVLRLFNLLVKFLRG